MWFCSNKKMHLYPRLSMKGLQFCSYIISSLLSYSLGNSFWKQTLKRTWISHTRKERDFWNTSQQTKYSLNGTVSLLWLYFHREIEGGSNNCQMVKHCWSKTISTVLAYFQISIDKKLSQYFACTSLQRQFSFQKQNTKIDHLSRHVFRS